MSCKGRDEWFIRSLVAYDISALMEYKNLSIREVCEEVVMKKPVNRGAEGGLIAIDKHGTLLDTNAIAPKADEGMKHTHVLEKKM